MGLRLAGLHNEHQDSLDYIARSWLKKIHICCTNENVHLEELEKTVMNMEYPCRVGQAGKSGNLKSCSESYTIFLTHPPKSD